MAQAGTLAAMRFTPNGLPGSFANYLLAPQTLPRAFMNEYVNVRNMQRYKNEVSRFRQCTLLAIIIWACLDPTNILVPPAMSTFVIAFS